MTSRAGLHGFDAAFEQLGRTTSPTVVTSIAKMLEYPLDRVVIEYAPATVRARPGVMTGLGLLVALAAAAVPSIIRRARRR